MAHRARDPRARRRRPDLPRGHAHPPRRARARPSAASAAWRWRPARRSCRSPSSAPRTSAAAGASARTRSASAPAGPLTFPRVETPSPAAGRAPSPSGSGPASSCSGSGWAACRGSAARPSSAPARGEALASAAACARAWTSRSPTAAGDLDLAHQDLVVLAAAARRAARAAAALDGRLQAQAGVVVLTQGLVVPLPERPAAPFAHLGDVTALPLPFLRRPNAPAQRPASWWHGAAARAWRASVGRRRPAPRPSPRARRSSWPPRSATCSPSSPTR